MTHSIANFNKSVISNPVQLKVVEVSDLTIVQKVAHEWFDVAKCRFRTADKFSHSRNPVCNSDMLDRLEASKSMTQAIHKRVTSVLNDDLVSPPVRWTKALACVDKDSKIQALALIDDEENKIVYIATNPNNIPTPLSKLSQRVRGAGTQIILHLAKDALKTGNAIRLSSIDSSEPFYDKLGFAGYDINNDRVLTVTKIKELISSKIPPFDQLQIEGGPSE